ncbi:Calcium-transporting ATPase [Planctomycetes bacterium Poly30]|uniref:Calcium-transporting ATPase n=1 Tax=Saltatorellus ferox TaxID=2528018 RepID=A0A518EVG7_9BACT|nr:Calcium-transporting ATPase [Planctomycetes bacterium Poly30]
MNLIETQGVALSPSPRSSKLQGAAAGGEPENDLPEAPWGQPVEDVLEDFGTTLESGLSEAEAALRLEQHGPNVLQQAERITAWKILLAQFKSSIIWLLIAVSGLALALGEPLDSAAVMTVVLINAAIGFFIERRAVQSVDALRSLGNLHTTVRRGGRTSQVPAENLVPGDIVLVEAGDVLTADLRLVESPLLCVDESALTGESLPVTKSVPACATDASLSDRTCMLHKGTAVFTGSAVAVVVATGMRTALGEITDLVVHAEAGTSPLNDRLNRLARTLIGLTLVVAAFVTIMMFVNGRGLLLAVEIGIALAVATVPEGLPVVATIALARGMGRMAKRSALVENMAAVETLGSTSVLMTDKTGTLTENRMVAVEYALPEGTVRIEADEERSRSTFFSGEAVIEPLEDEALLEALEIGALCNRATLEETPGQPSTGTGDPTEIALLGAADRAGIDRVDLKKRMPLEDERAFDPATKLMATIHARDGALFAAIKGAPEAVLETCTRCSTAAGSEELTSADRQSWLDRTDAMAARGQRVLGLARTRGDAPFEYADLEFVGLVGLLDPPRAGARGTVERLRAAGIEVIMVTGDHVATGTAIASEVGICLLDDQGNGEPELAIDAREIASVADAASSVRETLSSARVIGRASPRQKLDLIALHQERGEVVAMIGDGVNDAPALRKADIGVAMGLRGTQVAREAADMVLRNDDIASILAAVEEGRSIFRNIRRFVVYLMSCNVSEIFVVGAGSMLSGPLPVLPLHILFLNMVTDVFPALALGTCRADEGILREAPRPEGETILLKRHWRNIFSVGVIMAASVMSALGVAVHVLDLTESQATTTAFLTLAMAQLWHTLSMSGYRSHLVRNEVTENPYVWSAIAGCAALLVLAVYWGPMRRLLSLAEVGVHAWSVAVFFSLIPMSSVAVWRALARLRTESTPS